MAPKAALQAFAGASAIYRLPCARISAATAPKAALKEIGAARELIEIDLKGRVPAEYLKLNSYARVPPSGDDGPLFFEAAA